jgi:integrase
VRKNLPADLRVVALLGFTYGMRHNEVIGLDWERNVDFEAREIRLLPGETKNGAGRTLEMTAEVEAALHEHRANVRVVLGRVPAYVFPLLPDGHLHNRLVGTQRQSFRKAWARATRAAGVPGLLFHDLRRSAVRNLVRAGVAPQVAQTISGHKSASVLARYNIISKADRADAIKKLESFHRNGGVA